MNIIEPHAKNEYFGFSFGSPRTILPYFEQARLVLVCKKMYSQFLTEENVIDGEGVKKWYKDDYHKMYVSEITKVLVK